MSTSWAALELDDELLQRAMELYGTRTKQDTVDLALRRLVGPEMTRDEALSLEGTGWVGQLERMRRDGSLGSS